MLTSLPMELSGRETADAFSRLSNAELAKVMFAAAHRLVS